MVLVLSNDDVRSVLGWSEAVDACERLLHERAAGLGWFSPRQKFVMPTGTALLLLPGAGSASECMGARLYATATSNSSAGTATSEGPPDNAFTAVFDMETGALVAIAAGYWINMLRTAGVAAVGTKQLAKQSSRHVGVLGAGPLALASLMTLRVVLDIEKAKVFSPNPRNRVRFCSAVSGMADFPVVPAESAEDVLEDADIVVTATNSIAPVFDGTHLRQGTHVNCTGGQVQLGGRELDENAMARFDVLAVLDKQHTIHGGIGDDPPNANFVSAITMGKLVPDRVVEIADIIAGRARGRQSDQDVTLFDNRGIGAFDVALAYRAYQLAKERGVGSEVTLGAKSVPWL